MNLNTEANLQAEFYHFAKLRGWPVVLELITNAGRVDIALLSKDRTRLLALVECKCSPIYFAGGKSAQIARYKTLGVPVYGLSDIARTERLVATVIERCGNMAGIPIADLALRGAKRAKRQLRVEWPLVLKGERV